MAQAKVLICIFGIILSSIPCNLASEVCLSLSQREEVTTQPQESRLKQGKQGPVGLPGIKGEHGEPGQCQCDVDGIRNELMKQLHLQEDRINEIEGHINSTCQRQGGIKYGNQCIKLAYSRGAGVNYGKALVYCRGNLAEITSEAMYDAVSRYVANTWLEYTDGRTDEWVDVWLAMSYELSDNPAQLITLTNGTKITLARWIPRHPLTTPNYVKLVLRAWPQNPGNNLGLWNLSIKHKHAIPLCKIY